MQMQCNCIKIAILRPCEALFIFTHFPHIIPGKVLFLPLYFCIAFALHLHCIWIAKAFSQGFPGSLDFHLLRLDFSRNVEHGIVGILKIHEDCEAPSP